MSGVDKRQLIKIWIEVFLLALAFGLTYFSLQHVVPETLHFRRNGIDAEHISLSESIYFSLVTQSTIGHDVLIPKSLLARAVASLQLITVLGMFAYFAVYVC